MDLIDSDALFWASVALLALGITLRAIGTYFDWLLTDWEDRWRTDNDRHEARP